MMLPFVTHVQAQGGLRYTVQVSDFENRAGASARWNLGDAWDAVLTERLNNSGHFIVIATADMRNRAMDEQDLAQSGRVVTGDKTAKTGLMTPAQLIIKGTIDSFDDGTSGKGANARVQGIGLRFKGGASIISGTVSLVDVTTGQEIASHRFEEKVRQAGVRVTVQDVDYAGDFDAFKKTPAGRVIAKACDNVIAFLKDRLPSITWRGKVIKARGETILINRGTREGVSVGDILRVGFVEEIRDPDTGELLDQDLVSKGFLRVTRVKEKISYCAPHAENGKKPYKAKEGQTVFHRE
ncbi:hypothetical protein J3U88_28930 [Acanthopleuribacter pedis]|uniref:Curli production assembly/transport component CsgG n=2 Tax=Acanthopleuribacter pedis TaxID=442870 RepID=A0A8J7U5G5_9BACT|nr:hypothetical protein [Acanthopleuribacter pedis]